MPFGGASQVRLVVLGLGLSSRFDNPHAATFRSLLKALAARDHRILFLERDLPWHAANRDLTDPDYCRLEFYSAFGQLDRWRNEIIDADAVVIGSRVEQGVQIARYVQRQARGITAFYDLETPETLARLDRCEFHYLSPAVIPGYDVYLSVTGGPTLAYIEERYGSPAARALYDFVDPDGCWPADVPKSWDLSCVGVESPDAHQLALLLEAALRLPDRRFLVAGPALPKNVDWPANVDRIEPCSPSGHAELYRASRFTLDPTAADRTARGWSPCALLFEAAACEVPVITRGWPGLDGFFEPNRDILVAGSAEQAVEILERMDNVAAAAIGRAARSRAMTGHTVWERAAELECYLYEAGAAAAVELSRAS